MNPPDFKTRIPQNYQKLPEIQQNIVVHGVVCVKKKSEKNQKSFLTILGNDPSAGSPTETLLRLLLPLNDQV
jgi:hypothetical protein